MNCHRYWIVAALLDYPGYLILGLGMSATKMGFYTTPAFTIVAIAQPGVGWLSDWLIIKGG